MLIDCPPAVACLPLILPLLGVGPASAQSVLSDEQWVENITFVADTLEREHANAFHTVGRAGFLGAVETLVQAVPDLEDHRILMELKRIVASVGDGHTALRGGVSFLSGYFPVQLYLFSEGLFVIAADRSLQELVGSRILAIGGVPA